MVQWKSVRTLKWSDAEHEEAYDYLAFQRLPKHLEADRYKVHKFKRSLAPFSIESGEIVLIDHDPPPWAFNRSGKPVLPYTVPNKYTVVKKGRVVVFLDEYWSSPALGSFKGAQSIFDKIQRYTIGITRAMVIQFVNSKETKQLTKNASKRPVLKPILTQYPNQQWEMDLVDLSRFKNMNKKYTFVLGVIDCFSKFLWLRPLKTKTAENTVEALQSILFQEGLPETISSDRGSEFIADKTQDFVKEMGINQIFSSAYHPESQGQIERVGRTWKNQLYSYLIEYKTAKYEDVLSAISFAYNTSVHSTIRYMPFQVHKNRTVNIQLELQSVPELVPITDKSDPDNVEAHQTQLAELSDNINEDVTNRLVMNGEYMKDYTKRRGTETQLPVGTLVRINIERWGSYVRANKTTVDKKIKWSEELYQIFDVDAATEPVMYKLRLKDDGTEQTRSYFQHELQVITKLIYRKDRPASAKPRQQTVIEDISDRADTGAAKSTRSKVGSVSSNVSLDLIKHF